MMFWFVTALTLFLSLLTVYSKKNETTEVTLASRFDVSNVFHMGGKSYYFCTVFEGSYFKAMQFCNKHGMRLASITSAEENVRLGKFAESIGHNTSHFWTAGTTLHDDARQEWIWLTTGARILYTNWYPGEPNRGSGETPEYCLEVRSIDDDIFTWNDAPCEYRYNFICESNNPNCNIPS